MVKRHTTTKPAGPRPTMDIKDFEALVKASDGKVRVRR